MVVMMTELFQRQFLKFAILLGALMTFATFAASAHAKTAQILVVGDSLSAGYGLSAGEGWVDLLTKKLAREKISAHVINASISGDTTAGGVSRLPALLAGCDCQSEPAQDGRTEPGIRRPGPDHRHADAAQLRTQLHRTV
jgi:hypothetical protein